ncbi:MAG: hypothetical protein HZA14_02420 [Nitrospirae bacterium]|nr:hypothetical protein [Nitrospirota bacterium]
MKEVALIAACRVEWPRMGGKEAVLGLAKSGEVVWQYGLFISDNPTTPSENFVQNTLKPFPEINKPISEKCEQTKSSSYLCKL